MVFIRDENSGRCCGSVPLQDQQLALCLLLEVAVQRGSLPHFLDTILLLIQLHEKGRLEGAPLVPLLKRFQTLKADSGDRYSDLSSSKVRW